MSWTGKALVLGFKYLELQTDHWRAQDCKPISFGVQQLLSLTPPPHITAIAPQHLHEQGDFFPLPQHRGVKDSVKTYVLSKASFTFFPLAERKLDLKCMELSRRMRGAELWKCWQAGEKWTGFVWRKQSLWAWLRSWSRSVRVETPDQTFSWHWCQAHIGHRYCLKEWLGFLLGIAFVAP